jgi:hypothetical protein
MTCTDDTVKEPAQDARGGRLVATVTDREGGPAQQMEAR